jgi:hypothetical protein
MWEITDKEYAYIKSRIGEIGNESSGDTVEDE